MWHFKWICHRFSTPTKQCKSLIWRLNTFFFLRWVWIWNCIFIAIGSMTRITVTVEQKKNNIKSHVYFQLVAFRIGSAIYSETLEKFTWYLPSFLLTSHLLLNWLKKGKKSKLTCYFLQYQRKKNACCYVLYCIWEEKKALCKWHSKHSQIDFMLLVHIAHFNSQRMPITLSECPAQPYHLFCKCTDLKSKCWNWAFCFYYVSFFFVNNE